MKTRMSNGLLLLLPVAFKFRYQMSSINTWLSIFNSKPLTWTLSYTVVIKLDQDSLTRRSTDDIGWDELNETLDWVPLEPSRNSLN